MQFFVFLIVFSVNMLLGFSLFSQETSLDGPGVPGLIEDLGAKKTIWFENDVKLQWQNSDLNLVDEQSKTIKISLKSAKKDNGSIIDSGVMESDLGGNGKKRAPLAYKNPKLGNTVVSKSPTDPLKNSGLKIVKSTKEKTSDGGDLIQTEYEDGSKNQSYISKTLKIESSVDSRGVLVWRNIEGDELGFHYKKTQWEDGSVIREYSKSDGSVSMVLDNQKNQQSFSFYSPSKELIQEVSCHQGSCEEN